MPKAYDTWTVHPHRPIEQLAENLWRVEGDLPRMPLKRVMTIAKMSDGRLVLHNPIALEESAMQEIESYGPVAFIVVPNGYHRLDSASYAKRYADAKVLTPRGSRKKVEEVVRVDGDYDAFPKDDAVSLEHARGVRDAEGVMKVRSRDGVTLVLNDLVFNMPHLPGVQGFILKHITSSSGGPKISRIGRLALVKDKREARTFLEELSATPDLVRVVVSHHQTIAERPGDKLREVAAAL